jgi:pilus assembly protein Flp/PilA
MTSGHWALTDSTLDFRSEVVNSVSLEEDHMKCLLVRFVREDEGQDLIEYALLATLIALAVLVGVTSVGVNLETWYANIGTTIGTWAALAA